MASGQEARVDQAGELVLLRKLRTSSRSEGSPSRGAFKVRASLAFFLQGTRPCGTYMSATKAGSFTVESFPEDRKLTFTLFGVPPYSNFFHKMDERGKILSLQDPQLWNTNL